MSAYVLFFKEIDRSQLQLAGGKGTNLADLSRIGGLQVPEGFCVTTEAYKKITANNPRLGRLLDELNQYSPQDTKNISLICARIRATIENLPLPPDMAGDIEDALRRLSPHEAFAVRSSATAEDLPAASFAGQQDTFLNIIGIKPVLAHISKCWASLFTDRAVIYRMHNGFGHHGVHLAVIIQRMVFPEASGILFTADPVTSNRRVLSIDAGFGLGEALVSGLVSADSYKVRETEIVTKRIATKKLAIYGSDGGGTQPHTVDPLKETIQVLTDDQILQLAGIGGQIETQIGSPQDIEWCLANGVFYIVQSRPITTLFPVPPAPDSENRVYVSVGHNQVMTDAMKPLGMSFFRLTTNAPMVHAGGRLFVDITRQLASPESRDKLIETFGHGDLLIQDAIKTIAAREGFIRPSAESGIPNPGYIEKELPWNYLEAFENNPAIVQELIRTNEASVEELKRNIQLKSGTALFDFIQEDVPQLKKLLFSPQSWEVIKIALYAASWINEKMNLWLGEKNISDILSQSVSNNITSEMGLALLDVADAVRPYPEVIRFLQEVKDESFLDDLARFEGGPAVREIILAYLDKYGMRCSGEIDITKTRWSENPSILVPMILSNIRNFEANAASRRFEQGRQEAFMQEAELLSWLRQLPGGQQKADETKRMIALLRNYIGYREYPKYGIIKRYFVYKQALLNEARALVQAGLLADKEDIFYFDFEELREVVQTRTIDPDLISQRKEAFRLYEKMTPPRVITSEGEIISGTYKRENLPSGALAGLPVSSGLVEGRARVISRMEDADLEDGDILITHFTDPGWTTLFVAIKALVTEVGGLMSHGAVIAREYGLPAVAGVEKATSLIRDGQRIRVNGTDGYIEML